MKEGWGGDVRVGDVEAGQVVCGVTEEVKQSVAGRRHHLRDRLIPPGLRYHKTTETETEREWDSERQTVPLNKK